MVLSPHRAQIRRFAEILILTAILLIAAGLRFYNLRTYPGWYSDEGSFINFAENLLQGKWQIFNLLRSPLIIGRPPFFLYILAGIIKVFGNDILVLRGLTAALGVLSVAILYGFARRTTSSNLALLAAMVQAIFPWSVFYSRIGFTYNLLAVLTILCVFASWMYLSTNQSKWFITAALIAGFGVASDYIGIVIVIMVLTIALYRGIKWLLVGLLVTASPVIAMMLPIVITEPGLFLSDTGNVYRSLSSSILNQFVNVLFNYAELFRTEVWVILGLIGAFFIPNKRARNLTLFVLVFSILLAVRTLVPVGKNFHYLIPIYPLLALGIAVFLSMAVKAVYRFMVLEFRPKLVKIIPDKKTNGVNLFAGLITSFTSTILILLFAIVPFIVMFFVDLSEITSGAGISYWARENLYISDRADADAAIQYLNATAVTEDMVVASPQLLWAFSTRKADYYQALACNGKGYPVVPKFPRDNFEFPCSLEHIRYAVVDPLASEWAADWTPDMDLFIQEISTWPRIFTRDLIEIYANPDWESTGETE